MVVDRIEGELAVIEVGGTRVRLPVTALPSGAGEGSVLVLALSDEQPDQEEMTERIERLHAQSNVGDDFTF
jgi:hypothetical protein